ncbi:MAG: hypothetical protein K0R51_2447 [Cytophagaceae bacterium]|jgi:hypothetical protein|nr:hypothetical protein [Cytophagaceae bacterium]
MKLYYYTLLLFTSLALFTTCKKKEDVKTDCEKLNEQLVGTYEITVTTYPLQTSQEGDTKDILVFPAYNCDGTIQFNNLFHFFGCNEFPFTDGKYFQVSYEDDAEWQGAEIQGTGSIIHGIFHFEGTVINRGNEYIIVLDGKKSSSFMRTSAC